MVTEKSKRSVEDVAYAANYEHLADELFRLNLRIRLHVFQQKKCQPEKNVNQYKGLFLTEDEIVCLLENDENSRGDTSSSGKKDKHGEEIRMLAEAIEQIGAKIQKRRIASIQAGIYLSLPHLARLFRLTAFEEECLLICLAPELNRNYEKFYAYLQDDITSKKPTVDLALNLLCLSRQEKLKARLSFDKQAPLVKYHLLQVTDHAQDSSSPLISRSLKLNDRIVNFLLGFGHMDAGLEHVARFVQPQTKWDQIHMDKDIQNRVQNFIQSYARQPELNTQNVVFHIYGPYGSEKPMLAEAICHDLGIPLITGDLGKIIDGQMLFEKTLELLGREAVLQPAAVCLDNFDCLLADTEKYHFHLKSALETIRRFSRLTFLFSSKPWKPQGLLNGRICIEIGFPMPDAEDRKYLWEYHLNGHHRLSPDVDFTELANKFRFTSGQIHDATMAAQNLALWRSPEDGMIVMEDLYAACRVQSNQKLITLARKIDPKYTLSDIVLPPDQLAQLKEIGNQSKYRHIVYGTWGFDRKLSYGKGLTALFGGPSGTGKTMAAEIIANELKLELYKIDLSQVVSKYIGETEKNLNKIFAEAESSNAILFFDEADAIFGKRSEVKDAHDRYANIEIGYLLQKMEEYEGITILASNLKQNIDDAFVRRMRFIVEFPFPDKKLREQIWRNIFPKNASVSEEIDYKFLSERFELTGGNINNIALSSAFYAAEESTGIAMHHIVFAVKREFQKMEKLCMKEDFGEYYEIIKVGYRT